MDGRRVLVLGGGFLGSATVRRLLADSFEVTVFSRTAPALRGEDVNLVLGDVGAIGDLARLIAATDYVVYALGSASPAESELDPAADVSAVLPPVIRLLELLKARQNVSLTFISSGGAVYGNAPAALLDESVEPRPVSSYGLLKLTAEKYVQMYSRRFGFSARILRVANAYGPGQSWSGSQGIVAHLMRKAYTGEPIDLYGPRESVRDFVFIEDVADVVVRLLAIHDGPQIVNVGSGTGCSVDALLKAVQQVSGRVIEADYYPPRKFDVLYNVLDCTVLRGLIAFQPTPLKQGLTATWQAALDMMSPNNSPIVSGQAPGER